MLIRSRDRKIIIDAKTVWMRNTKGNRYEIRAKAFEDEKETLAEYYGERLAFTAMSKIYDNARQGQATDLSLPLEGE